MLSFKSKTLFSVMAVLTAGTAAASQPLDSVTSDPSGNTAMGQLALALLSTPDCSNTGSPAACFNTAAGAGSLYSNSSGGENSAYGFQTLNTNDGGYANSAMGYRALFKNQVGSNNSAFGWGALYSFTGLTYGVNDAFGASALYSDTTGIYNAAFGSSSLSSNVSGNTNAAFGVAAMVFHSSGDSNTAVGYAALSNSNGSHNTGVGYQALANSNQSVYSSSENTALGSSALVANQTGNQNTALGGNALSINKTGSDNIALGYGAGVDITGSENVDIANSGSSSDGGVIRIGTSGVQTKAFMAGISTSKITGAAVYVTSAGQLGVLASSERYKNQIETMGAKSEKLQLLRPVTFHLKSEPNGEMQYGLIAEEVAKVYPELVIRDDIGKIQGVRYDELAPMLLNQMQKQQRQIERLIKMNESMQAALSAMRH